MTGLDRFRNIKDEMIWKGAALEQIETFEALAGRLEAPLKVVSSHTSKSIELPVVRFAIGDKEFFIRDNFYDYNLCVLSKSPIEISLSEIMDGILKPLDWAWYLGEVQKKRGYCYQYWTDEEMEDPRILRVFQPRKSQPNDPPMEWSVQPDEKDRWLKRMTDPSWYSKDWSSGEICWEGEFGPETTMYVQSRPYMEGIGKVVPAEADSPYRKGCKMFALALGRIEVVESMIRKLTR